MALVPHLDSFQPPSFARHLLVLSVLLALFYFVFVRRDNFPRRSPLLISKDLPIIGQTGFWTKRTDFWRHALAETKTKNFSFHLGKHRIIGTASSAGRQTYLENRDLGFAEGYAVLFGQSPSFTDREPNDKGDAAFTNNYFGKRLTAMLKREQFEKALPTLVSDVKARLRDLATSADSTTDPFDSVYRIVYLLTMRAVGPTEIAENRKLLDTTLHLFEQIEQSATPSQILFPWLPSPALLKRYVAGTRLYMIFQNIINDRKSTGAKMDDPLQFLLDHGDNTARIISFIVGALFAGQLNSGINAAWVLCYLGTSPRWLAEVWKEINSVADKYHLDRTMPLTERLTGLPLEAWETEFPLIDLCLRDSIRLQLHGTGFRRNISDRDIVVDNEVIPPGAFLLYHFGLHHLDPEIYADPLQWDPSRYFPDRAEDKKMQNAFIGWGAGRHPCLGMRFAKLEQNIITAFFIAMFDFEVLDDEGNVMHTQPPTNHNKHQASPPDRKVVLKYRLREEAVL